MKRKTRTLLIVALLLLAVVTGCGSSSKSGQFVEQTKAASFGGSDLAGRADYSQDAEYYASSEREEAGQGTGDFEKKVIKNGNISVLAQDVDVAYTGIMEIVHEIGGEEFNKNYTLYDTFKRIEIVLKIPPENLEIFEERLKSLIGPGKIRNINIRSSDITSEYYDIKSRLGSYKASRDQMLELLKRAETIEDTLKIQYEITRLEADIDSMEGQIRMWDSLISMSTITLLIEQEDSPFKTTEISWKFSSYEEIIRTMKNGFIMVVNNIYSLILWIVVGLVSFSPAILIGGIGIYIFLRVRKKKQQGKRED